MHKLAFPAPAPPALGSAAEPAARARDCDVYHEPLHGGRTLRCAQCGCGPFHPVCALPISGSQPRCPRCAQLVAARGAGAAAARVAGQTYLHMHTHIHMCMSVCVCMRTYIHMMCINLHAKWTYKGVNPWGS